MLREASRIALPGNLCVTRNRAACCSRRDEGIFWLCLRLRLLCACLVAVCARPRKANAWQGWASRQPIWRLPAVWKEPWSLGRTGVANSNLAPACFCGRSFPSASPCIVSVNTPCPPFLFAALATRRPIAPIAALAADELLRRPGTEPHERSTIPDTAAPKRRPADALHPVPSPRLACLLSFFFRPPNRPFAGTGLSPARLPFADCLLPRPVAGRPP
jgi:hypothetical protein